MSKKNPVIVIVMPAYNAAKTVKDTYYEIPKQFRNHVILVDDQSKDNTVEVSKKLGIATYAHPNNTGYGGNQKTCYWEALKFNPDVVVMLHPDYQYDASVIEELINPILNGKYDYMFGSRIATRGGALAGGMPKMKYYINRLDTILENILLGVNFSEHFSGYRAFSKKLLLTIPFQRFSNDFVFDQQMKVSVISYGFKTGEIAIETRYHEKASSIRFLRGAKFLIETYGVIASYLLHLWGIKKNNLFASRKQ
jgi:glycosyltransferase involved in cell wall biosynthesis